MEISIPELNEIKEKLDQILRRLEELKFESNAIPEWIDVRKAAELKSIPFSTLNNRVGLQPDSSEAKIIGGRRRWHKTIILKWLSQTDEDLNYVPPRRKTKKV